MSISDLFDTGFRGRNQDHFAAIVRVAMEDDVITDSEKKFLDRLALNLDISPEDYKSILKNYKSHPINPPISFNYRIERLYDLARMVHVDHIDREDEIKLLTKMAVGLGFSTVNVGYIVDKALRLVKEDVDLDNFIDGIRTMNH
ncbi:MAG: TerB family tellurite resistance protein [Flavobacteriaceae bacterium]|nr:TerB family tellurite resistance protein [Bacteroidia bacterium]MBT8270124.1 TerB family tellurite resistance protein [Bacteroidia bacterium]NNF74046.1 TerB family tellurite resistance protein [Flavobacteriaceae bacterium]NNK71401.1 TerB family tellurite resistance protein [Flavobacteriaceae bacterium]NNL79502.1 TerB family tellurite resistance protein [Flavobacteriaceae bacterium]